MIKIVNIEFLDKNKIKINYAGDPRLIDSYINKIMFHIGINPYPAVGGGWIAKYSDLNKIKDNFSTSYVNDYTPPPYLEIGSTMKLEPFEYQKEAIYEALKKEKMLMVLPCGSGKTPILIGAYVEAVKKGIVNGKGLIIVKASLKKQWENEVTKFSDFTGNAIKTYSDITKNYTRKIKRLEKQISESGISNEDKRQLIEEINELNKKAEDSFNSQFDDGDLLIANYETLIDDRVLNKLKSMNLDFIGCDEIHYVKSRKAARSKALYELSDAKMKIGATATPITKDPQDVYGIFKFIDGDILGKVGNFEKLYIKYAGYGKINGFKNMDKLRDKISGNVFLKTKEEVSAHLPKLNVIKKYIDLTHGHEEAYERILQELDELNLADFEIRRKCKSENEAMLNEDLQKISARIMALQTFAQELADSNELLLSSESEMAKEYAIKSSENPKLDYCIELVSQIISSEEKVVIFSKFERMQGVLTRAINKLDDNIKIAYVNGSLSSSQRYEEAYSKFRDNDEYKVLLCSDAGAEGLNLSLCKYLIEYELATSYAIQTQRHGRLERADSVHGNVTVYQLIANNSWDILQEKIIDKKEGFDSDIIKSIANKQ